VWQLVTIAGFIAGSLLGGVLAASSWRLSLGLVPLIALLCFQCFRCWLPETPANPQLRDDWPGLISIAGAMVLFSEWAQSRCQRFHRTAVSGAHHDRNGSQPG
jgi:MFS family permease